MRGSPVTSHAGVWAETGGGLADEFRDGNVAAIMAPLAVANWASAALPETVMSFYSRDDSASHEKELLGWIRDETRRWPSETHQFRREHA